MHNKIGGKAHFMGQIGDLIRLYGVKCVDLLV